MHRNKLKMKQQSNIKVYLEILVLFFLLGFTISKIQQSAQSQGTEMVIEQESKNDGASNALHLINAKS